MQFIKFLRLWHIYETKIRSTVTDLVTEKMYSSSVKGTFIGIIIIKLDFLEDKLRLNIFFSFFLFSRIRSHSTQNSVKACSNRLNSARYLALVFSEKVFFFRLNHYILFVLRSVRSTNFILNMKQYFHYPNPT